MPSRALSLTEKQAVGPRRPSPAHVVQGDGGGEHGDGAVVGRGAGGQVRALQEDAARAPRGGLVAGDDRGVRPDIDPAPAAVHDHDVLLRDGLKEVVAQADHRRAVRRGERRRVGAEGEAGHFQPGRGGREAGRQGVGDEDDLLRLRRLDAEGAQARGDPPQALRVKGGDAIVHAQPGRRRQGDAGPRADAGEQGHGEAFPRPESPPLHRGS